MEKGDWWAAVQRIFFFFFLRPRVGSAATTELNENRNKLQKFTKIGSARDETLYNSQKRAMETF